MEVPDNLHLLYNKYEIKDAVKRIAGQIQCDYADRCPCLVPVLDGAMMFAADLIRNLRLPRLELHPVRLKSYKGTENAGDIVLELDVSRDKIRGKNVIIVEDIIDSGRTMDFFRSKLREKEPNSISICTLCDKPEARQIEIPISYRGFVVPNRWIVGYGMDYDDMYRDIYGIYVLKDKT